ncbi:sortase [Diplocloster agilis]|uniref:sortase n=1 Tax=Diplocloster agilis TaxID=2850323 RepID=UPI000820402B|nr:sortase [Suonthocola fibrivorans]MCU6736295.1 sortase [Suonthocola fibrivorans]SCJ88860.1 Sortase (surface protein transpeptidase) [uncultured Clostridium sp.]
MGKATYRAAICMGILCLLFAASLTAYNLIQDIQVGNESERIYHELGKRMGNGTRPERLNDGNGVRENPILPDYAYDSEFEMPTVENDSGIYIGILSIPELNIGLPVAAEWSYAQLKKTPCRYFGSAYLNDMVVCAHNYRTHFGALSTLSVGSPILFTDMDGNEFYYEVFDVEILGADQETEMTSYDEGLTLFTCTFGGKNRVTVRAVRIEAEGKR